MSKNGAPPPLGEVIYEFHVVGHLVKVSAIDTRSFTEVSIMGSAKESRTVLQATALRKLQYVLAKKQGGS